MIRKGNDIVFNEDSGYIQHRSARRKTDFVEREGVYFANMKMLGGVNPSDTVSKCDPSPSAKPER